MKHLKLFESFNPDSFNGLDEQTLRSFFVHLIDDFELQTLFTPEDKGRLHTGPVFLVVLKPRFQYYNNRLQSWVNLSNWKLAQYIENEEFKQSLKEIRSRLSEYDLQMKPPHTIYNSIRIIIYK